MRALIPDDVIFSLRRVFVDGLLSGRKCVELRRRIPSLDNGTRVWLYSKMPDGELLGVGILSEVDADNPRGLWKKYAQCSGLTEAQFFTYFEGVKKGAALTFETVTRLRRPIPLSELKELEPNFHPPQFFRRVKSDALRCELGLAEMDPPCDPCDH
jgi:predicted transcriptional regulator